MSLSSPEAAIPSGDRLLIDTTVLAAFQEATDATHPVAKHVLEEFVASGRNPALVSMITLEMLVGPLRASPPGQHTVLAFLQTYPNLVCVPIDLQVAKTRPPCEPTSGSRRPTRSSSRPVWRPRSGTW